MMKLKKAKKIEAYIPTASTADIAFLLITFFMVTSTFPLDRSNVILPVTEMRFQVDDASAAWIVANSESGQVKLLVSDGKDLSKALDETALFPIDILEAWIYDQTSKATNKLFLLKIDHRITYDYADSILSAIKNANSVRNIVFLSQPKQL